MECHITAKLSETTIYSYQSKHNNKENPSVVYQYHKVELPGNKIIPNNIFMYINKSSYVGN